jgi:2-oxoglutarate ferredoxin oxidoreductase subunit delta
MSPQINGQGYHYVVQVRDTCTGCVSCALVCPDAVIKVYRSGTKSKRPVAVIQGVTRDLQVTVP